MYFLRYFMIISTSLVFSPRIKTEWESSFFCYFLVTEIWPLFLCVVCLFLQNIRACWAALLKAWLALTIG